MPELPEVETIRKQLNKHLLGKELLSLELLDEKLKQSLKPAQIQSVLKSEVKAVERIAKALIIKLDNKQNLIFHLKMTGKLIIKAKDISIIAKHNRLIMHFNQGLDLIFNDLRKFGWLKIIADQPNLAQHILKTRIGPEPFAQAFTNDYLIKALKSSRQPIKTFLLDQKKVAGIGNIYANEALFVAKIHPTLVAYTLSKDQAIALRTAILQVLQKGLDLGGASDNDYLNAYGQKGEYQKHFLVYRRDKQKCEVCKDLIKRIKIGGRGTFYCPSCQKKLK